MVKKLFGRTATQTQTTIAAPPHPLELEFAERQIELLDLQLEQFRTQQSLIPGLLELSGFEPTDEGGFALSPERLAEEQELFDLQRSASTEALQRSRELGDLELEIATLNFERLRDVDQGPTPEQQALIDQAANAAIAAGESDIDRALSRSLKIIGQELAPSRGLRPGDSPILDEAGFIAEESVRQKGQLTRNIRQFSAGAGLDLPLNTLGIAGTQGTNQQALQQATSEFQQRLAQMAAANRMNMLSGTAGIGLGLATGVSPGFGFSPRGGTTTGTSSRGGNFGDLLGAVGGLLTGVGAVRGP